MKIGAIKPPYASRKLSSKKPESVVPANVLDEGDFLNALGDGIDCSLGVSVVAYYGTF